VCTVNGALSFAASIKTVFVQMVKKEANFWLVALCTGLELRSALHSWADGHDIGWAFTDAELWFGSLTVRTSDLGWQGCGFDSRSSRRQVAVTWIGDCLWTGKLSTYAI